jgi:hypothetical protein
MNDERIDGLIRKHLDREAANVDADALWRRLQERRQVSLSRRAWFRRALAIGGGAAIAAGVGGILFFGPATPQAMALASAEELIAESRTAHSQPTDRLYEVTTEWDPAILKRLQVPNAARGYRVWTRGDLYWIQPIDDANWSMGQDASGKLWFTFNRKRGMVYETSEVGEPLLRYLELVSLKLASTLGELLADYKLLRKDGGQPGEPIRIEAEIKPNLLVRNPRFHAIKLELEPETKAVREASFERKYQGETVGRMRFKLLKVDSLDAKVYDVRGHVDADADVVDRKDALKGDRRAKYREEFLKRLQSRMPKQ